MKVIHTFLKDSDWNAVSGKACRVVEFNPIASVEKGKVVAFDRSVPYATVILEYSNGEVLSLAKGFITHKTDFFNLWAAFRQRGIRKDEEVILFWGKEHIKRLAKLFFPFMPKIWLMICPEGAFRLMTDSTYLPKLTGEARWKAQKPIVDWKPEVLQ